MAPLPISCFIIAKNEADRIGRTLASVRELADEIVVIDSGSTDGTQDIARAAGARVIFNAWPGFGQQKRFGEDQCRHDWLLNLDADEVVSGTLDASIRAVFASLPPQAAVYGMPALVVYPARRGHGASRVIITFIGSTTGAKRASRIRRCSILSIPGKSRRGISRARSSIIPYVRSTTSSPSAMRARFIMHNTLGRSRGACWRCAW